MGLGLLFVVFGALGREFSGKLWARCAKFGQDGSKLRPRWATMASRWPSWSQLWRLWGHLGRNLDDFEGVWGGFGRHFGTWLGLGPRCGQEGYKIHDFGQVGDL